MRDNHRAEMIEKKVVEAKEVCEGDETSDECKVAWDEVEEVSQAKADFRRRLEKQDPLEYYCQDNPETDECRVYEDWLRTHVLPPPSLSTPSREAGSSLYL